MTIVMVSDKSFDPTFSKVGQGVGVKPQGLSNVNGFMVIVSV